MDQRIRSIFDTRIIFGLAIIVVGVVLFLENMGVIGNVRIWVWWPLILIVLGITQLAQPRQNRQICGGLLLLLIGGLFLGSNLGYFSFKFWDLWPLILILIGFSILKQTVWGRKVTGQGPDFIHLSFVLGGGDHTFSSKKLNGGKISAVLGGGSIDLREADFEGDQIEINVFAFWGGFDITVPKQWQVNVLATPLLGGIENKAHAEATTGAAKTLIITGSIIMGGVEIKN